MVEIVYRNLRPRIHVHRKMALITGKSKDEFEGNRHITLVGKSSTARNKGFSMIPMYPRYNSIIGVFGSLKSKPYILASIFLFILPTYPYITPFLWGLRDPKPYILNLGLATAGAAAPCSQHRRLGEPAGHCI